MKINKKINYQNAVYLQAAESYSIVFLETGKSQVICRPLKNYAPTLVADGWCRIHRSFLVNPIFVKSIAENRTNLFLQNGDILPISRRNLKTVLHWRSIYQLP
ncbi:MAG: LytTR family transcriptional regulator DNA-binding domain-containing protein [Bacteroidota bacterium]